MQIQPASYPAKPSFPLLIIHFMVILRHILYSKGHPVDFQGTEQNFGKGSMKQKTKNYFCNKLIGLNKRL